MSSRHDERERLGRLAGTGEGSGGGLMLPVLFLAILTEMLDSGPASTGHLTGIAASALKGQSNNVRTTWGSVAENDPNWKAFTDDVLAQMASQEIISRNGAGLWDLGGKFTTGVPLVIIPAGDGRKADGVTIWSKGEREERSSAVQALRLFNEYDAQTADRGHRLVSPARKELILESMRQLGDLREYFPVMLDEQGDIVDGHHRREIDPAWPARPERVPVDKRLAVSLAANRTNAWTAKDWKELHDKVSAAQNKTGAGRTLSRLALLEDASRSDSEIADLVGVSHPTVADERSSLVNFTGENRIHDYVFSGGGRGRRPGKHSAECWCGEGEATPRPKPKTPAASGSPQPRKMDEPAMRAWIRQRLEAEEEIRQSELCDLFGVSQYVALGAAGKEKELFLKEQLAAKSAAAPPAVDPAPPAPGPTPGQAPSPPPAFAAASPPAAPESQPEPGPAPIDYGDMLRHLQAVANLEPDRIIADLGADGDQATVSEVFKWATAARDTVEYLTELLERGESYEQEEELGEDLG